jgi:hypothetical protein
VNHKVLLSHSQLTQHGSLFNGVSSVCNDESIRGRTFTTQDLVGELGDLENDGRVQGFRSDVDDLVGRASRDPESVNTTLESGPSFMSKLT